MNTFEYYRDLYKTEWDYRQTLSGEAAIPIPAVPPVSAEQRQAWKVEVDSVAAAIDTAWRRLKGKAG